MGRLERMPPLLWKGVPTLVFVREKVFLGKVLLEKVWPETAHLEKLFPEKVMPLSPEPQLLWRELAPSLNGSPNYSSA